MKPSEIKNLIDFISKSGLNEVNIETEQFKLSVKREADAPKVIEQIVSAPVAAAPQAAVAAPATAPAPAAAQPAATPAAEAAPAASNEDKYITINSTMIGTFYKSPSPDAAAFLKVGDTVSPGKTICIIEAMKLFNEIESEVSGKVVEILVEDATPVEFGTPLYRIDPS
ncbi:acetyl-CoA carboxylase biotin carboxyl carrier protein [Aureibacter tunicatorum]|uniref:Biotin carboxyl carrier protein of acetyl-CoA carboxylase n=1 Tax=Aureibacter tunicatorum TaxID=866807 RepID=A0AAE4BSH8_9BACT|nr:acetyl-CoA carboxylase biotin carboxyl carrier protein [Aureibacter tunicatorum]MDR6241254.1 acetyl-CoA carboxylase biotin carboxyl carrier protein [Aureibacter tunicatorum]BDD03514.1 acetyl-CoA carboxylase, biotin carboxyl carrier protein [Aureibacter tunicatorum]